MRKNFHFVLLHSIILQFDKTFALLIGTLLIKIAQNKEDLESILIFFKKIYLKIILKEF